MSILYKRPSHPISSTKLEPLIIEEEPIQIDKKFLT